jgi:hypothetical protein
MGATWCAIEGVGAARGMMEVDEARDEEATKGHAVEPPGVVVGLPALFHVRS